MHLPEQGTVEDGEEDGDEQQEEDRSPADPRERNERREDAARPVLVAPAELGPECLRGVRAWLAGQSGGKGGTYRGDGSADQPEDEEDEEPDHLSEEAREDAVLKHSAWPENVQPKAILYCQRT